MYGIGWEQYLNGLQGGEWGDQLALIGRANAFGVATSIVPSLYVDIGIQYIYPQNSIVGQPCIFLGHEFETHYIRLVPLYETTLMPRSNPQSAEDQGGPGYDQQNLDIRDASEDDQQSADSFGESVDDQQCVDNRRKADENEQSTDGLSHVVDDLYIVAALQTTIGQKIVAEPQTTTNNLLMFVMKSVAADSLRTVLYMAM